MVNVQSPPGTSLLGPEPFQGMWTPQMARAMIRRWISEVPSKIVSVVRVVAFHLVSSFSVPETNRSGSTNGGS